MGTEEQGSSRGGRLGVLRSNVKRGGREGRVNDLYKTWVNMKSQVTMDFSSSYFRRELTASKF